MTNLDLDATLETIKARQWGLKDIDWDAPGAELVTDEQKLHLKAFMADLMWIEHIGARSFAGLALNAPTPQLREIYTYFHAEEQKHANAELALMKRWGLLQDGEIPLPNVQICYAMDMVDKTADVMPFEWQATSIPMLEVALDGALLKFLTDEIKDPLLTAVLNKVNADESRHLAVGFHVMGMLSGAPLRRFLTIAYKMAYASRLVSLRHTVAMIPMIAGVREQLFRMGMDGSRLSIAFERYRKASKRDPRLNHNPLYKLISMGGRLTMERHPVWSRVEGWMSSAAGRIPPEQWPARPSWSGELTYQAAV